jgi:hypothetical protein
MKASTTRTASSHATTTQAASSTSQQQHQPHNSPPTSGKKSDSSASQSGFSLGAGSMLFKTIFTFLNIPFMEIEPRAWQKDIFGELGIQYDKATTKQASVQAARLLFPGFDFRPTQKCKKDSDGLTDSALIASHCLKINNK